MRKTIIYLVSNFTFKESKIRDGDKIRSLNILKGFLDLDYEVYLFSVDNKYRIYKENNTHKNLNFKNYKSFVNFGPLRSTSFSALKDIELILDKKNESYIVAEGLHASVSTIFLPKKYSNRLFLNIVDCNTYAVMRCLIANTFSIKFFKTIVKLFERYISEYIVSFSKGELFFVSESDSKYFANLFGRESALFKNGVQEKAYKYKHKKNKKFFNIIFIGNMSTPANKEGRDWLINEIFKNKKIIKEKKLKFIIAGINSSKEILINNISFNKLKELNILEIKDSPRSFEKLLINSDIQICPIKFGTGIKNTVLEGMSLGLPQLVTNLIAKPIGIKNNVNGLVKDRNDFVNEIIKLREIEKIYDLEKISKTSWDFIISNYSWKKIIKNFSGLYLNRDL